MDTTQASIHAFIDLMWNAGKMSFKLECIAIHTGFGLLGDVSTLEYYNSS